MKLLFSAILFFTLLMFCNAKQKQNSNECGHSTFGQSTAIAHGNQETEPSVKNINIKDIFLLLPDNVFPEVITVAQRKALLKCTGEEIAFKISPTPIGVCDVKNGYLNLTGMEYAWELCYWNLKDGRKLVVINTGTESGSELRTFFCQNGELNEDTNYKLGGNKNYKLTDFIDVSQLSSDTRKFAEQQFANGAWHIYYQLPQSGTSLKVSIDTDQLMDYNETHEIPYEATKEVTLKWENEKWVKGAINAQQISLGEKWLKSIFQCDDGNDYYFPDEVKVCSKRYYEFFIESLAIFEYSDFETEAEQIAAEQAYKKKWKDIYPLDVEVLSPFGRGNGTESAQKLENVIITSLSDTKYTVFIDYGNGIKTTSEVTLIATGNSYLIDYMKSEYIE